MKRQVVRKKSVARVAPKEPLVERVIEIPTSKNGRYRLWSKVNDDTMVAYARKVMKENEITEPVWLWRVDAPLHRALKKRQLTERVDLGVAQQKVAQELLEAMVELDGRSTEKKGKPRRTWEDKCDEEIIEYAKKVIKDKKIKSRSELANVDSGLYQILQSKKLLNRVEIAKKVRNWRDKSDEELLVYTGEVMESNGITKKMELVDFDHGLANVLRNRGLWDKIDFEERARPGRPWKEMTDDELVEVGGRVVAEHGFKIRTELNKYDCGLYRILDRRKLLDKIFPENRNEKESLGKIQIPENAQGRKEWRKVDDETLVAYAKQVINENEISSKTQLRKFDARLYATLSARRLLNEIGLGERTVWRKMSNTEIINHALGIIRRDNITGRRDLEKRYRTVYDILIRRKLLDRVFTEIEENRETCDGIPVGPTGKRLWGNLDDNSLVDYARRIIEKNGLTRRSELEEFDRGLYYTLVKRRLMNKVFAEMEAVEKEDSEEQAAEEMLSAVKELGAA